MWKLWEPEKFPKFSAIDFGNFDRKDIFNIDGGGRLPFKYKLLYFR